MRWFGVAAEADRVVAVGEPCDSQGAAQDWAETVDADYHFTVKASSQGAAWVAAESRLAVEACGYP